MKQEKNMTDNNDRFYALELRRYQDHAGETTQRQRDRVADLRWRKAVLAMEFAKVCWLATIAVILMQK